jgi:glycopeptide antibiotics resistance protein
MAQYARLYGVMALVVVVGVVGSVLASAVAGAVTARRGGSATLRGVQVGSRAAFAVAVVVTAFMTFTPAGTMRGSSVNLVPLSTLAVLPTSGASRVQLVGNLLLLTWLGLLLPVVSRRARTVPRVVVVVAATALAIETLQYPLHLGRSSALDDVLLNTLGGAVAAWVGVHVLAPRLRRLESAAQRRSDGEVPVPR